MPEQTSSTLSIFFCGDVMTGRGVDQILPYPSDPTLHEPYVKNAKEYLRLAEEKNGLIPKPADFSYIWGDALPKLKRRAPDLRIINLETSVTTNDNYWKDKEIHYRMNPNNVPCLTAANINCCALANNHVLDWGFPGLADTLDTLKKNGIKSCGAGKNLNEAESPAILEAGRKGRVLVFSTGFESSGVPSGWAALRNRPGVNFVGDLSDDVVHGLRTKIEGTKHSGDLAIASIHWGANWGYTVPFEQQEFAHRLIDQAHVDVVHGHSSHHVKGIEIYRNKLVMYGCGDFLNDYEGIGGFESFRSDLCLMYSADFEACSGRLLSLEMEPMQIRRFRVNNASFVDAEWMLNLLRREERRFKCEVEMNDENILTLSWHQSHS